MTACIQLDDAEETKELFEKLADGAQAIDMELHETPWSRALLMESWLINLG